MEKGMKIFVAILLILTAFEMPADFYRLVSFIVVVAFSILAYNSHVNRKLVEVGTYLLLILVLQPFYSFDISKTTYIIINLVVAGGLLGSLFIKPKTRKPEN